MRSHAKLVTVTAICIAAMGIPLSAEESEPLSCACFSSEALWMHKFGNEYDLQYQCGGDSGLACHSIYTEGFCSQEHPGCGTGPVGLETSTLEDIQALALSDNAAYNPERKALQL